VTLVYGAQLLETTQDLFILCPNVFSDRAACRADCSTLSC